MVKKLAILALLFVGCKGEKEIVTINNLEADFPKTDTLVWSEKQTFDFPETRNGEFVKDSLLFVFRCELDPETEYGYCYNINTGEKIATVVGVGRSTSEMINPVASGRFICNDSIQITDRNNRIIRQFSINDIITKPLSERSGSTIQLKEFDFMLGCVIKLDNGLMFGEGECEKNMTNYFTYDGKEVKKYNTINKGILESHNSSKPISISSRLTSIGDKVITSSNSGVALTIIDSKTGKVINERYYNKYKVKENGFADAINSEYICIDMNCDEKNFYVVIKKTEKVKGEEPKYTFYLHVFDLELNPVKRYYLSNEVDSYNISADCTHMYYLKGDGDSSVLYEAKIQ